MPNHPVPRKPGKGQVAAVSAHMESYQGPLPHPEHFQRYDAILPGAADRILRMAEAQSRHRQMIERREQAADVFLGWCGILSAFLICVAAIAGGVYCIREGRAVSGTILGGAGLAAVVGAFLYGRPKKPERQPNR